MKIRVFLSQSILPPQVVSYPTFINSNTIKYVYLIIQSYHISLCISVRNYVLFYHSCVMYNLVDKNSTTAIFVKSFTVWLSGHYNKHTIEQYVLQKSALSLFFLIVPLWMVATKTKFTVLFFLGILLDVLKYETFLYINKLQLDSLTGSQSVSLRPYNHFQQFHSQHIFTTFILLK